ncbi:MAG: hypothetical protein M0P77_10080 [Firmicutes bacterium]|nr:hypothetical protein [Bacillota bacterium]
MKSKIILEVDKKEEMEAILEHFGLTIENITNVFYRRILNEQSIAFLFANHPESLIQTAKTQHNEKINNIDNKNEKIPKVTKTIAILLLKNSGLDINKHDYITFSSKNKTTNVYWSNPDFDYLQHNWKLILNDNINRKFHFFNIPKNTIDHNILIPRNDNLTKIDLQIYYDDPTFTDSRSGYSFVQFLIKTMSY